jgi:hypothetical protein
VRAQSIQHERMPRWISLAHRSRNIRQKTLANSSGMFRPCLLPIFSVHANIYKWLDHSESNFPVLFIM